MNNTQTMIEAVRRIGKIEADAFQPMTFMDLDCWAGADEGSLIYTSEQATLILSPSGVLSIIWCDEDGDNPRQVDLKATSIL